MPSIATSPQVHDGTSIGLSTDLEDLVAEITYGLLSPSPLFGTDTSEVPIDIISHASDGVMGPSFKDIYYNRIWIIPRHIGLGSIVSESHHEIEVWNSFFEARDLTAINTVGNATGETLTGSTSKTFNYLESDIYELTVNIDGAPNVDVQYHWIWDGLGDIAAYLAIDGQRVIPFKLRHNWSSTILEQIAYKTDVLPGQSGNEQRIRLRKLPRRRIEMSYLTLTPEERAYLENVLYGQALKFSVPLWQDVSRINTPIVEGQTVFSVDTVGRDYEVGAQIFLRLDPDTESLTVESFNDTSITTTEGCINAYPHGAYVCPARFGKLESKFNLGRITDQLETLKLAWVLDTDQHRANQLEDYSPTTYRDLEIYDTQNDYTNEQSIDQEIIQDIFDNQTGLIDNRTGEPVPRRTYPFTTLIEREDLSKFLQWLENRAGRLTPFWYLDRVPAFKLVAPVAFDSVFLTIEKNFYTQMAFVNPARRDIAVFTSAGWKYRRVTASVDNLDGTETLTIDSAPGVLITVEEQPLMCYLRCVRLSSDQVELTYETNNVIRTATSFVDLLQQP